MLCICKYEYGDRCFMNSVLNICKLLIKFIFKNCEFNIICGFIIGCNNFFLLKWMSYLLNVYLICKCRFCLLRVYYNV